MTITRNLILLCIFLIQINILTGQESKTLILKVGIVADVQYCDQDNKGSRHFRQSPDKLEEACLQFQNDKIDWMVGLGDFIDGNLESYTPLNSILQKQAFPVYQVIGNHDFGVADEKKQDVLSALGLKDRYYSIQKENWRFLFLDGTDISTCSYPKGSEEYENGKQMLDSLTQANAINAHPWNGAIGKKQIKWITEQLHEAEIMNQNIIAMCHLPIYPANGSENLWNDTEIKQLLDQFNGNLIFLNGHTHQSKFTSSNNIRYISFRGMVEGDENSFAIAEIYKDSVSIKGNGKEKSYSISFNQVKR